MSVDPRALSTSASRAVRAITVLVLGLLAFLQMALIIPVPASYDRLDLDYTWELELQNKLLQGELLGRDAFFTYGPGAQLLYSVSDLLRPDASVIDRGPLTYLVLRLAAVLVLIVTVLAIPRLSAGGIALFMVVMPLLISSPNFAIRALLGILPVMVLARALALPPGRRRGLVVAGVGLLCFVGQTMTFDVGLLGFATCCALLGVLVLWTMLRRFVPVFAPLVLTEGLVAGALLAAGFVLLNLVIGAWYMATGPAGQGLLTYQQVSLSAARYYNYIMGARWDLSPLMAMVLLSMAAYCAMAVVRRFPAAPLDRRLLYLGLAVATLVFFKSAIVRSETTKILMSATPLIVLFLLLVADSLAERRFSFGALCLLLVTIAAWPIPTGVIGLGTLAEAAVRPALIGERLSAVWNHRAPREAIVPPALQQELAPDSAILNFPYENMMAMALGRPNITPFLQPYAAHSLEHQQLYVDRAAPLKDRTEIIYSLDAITSGEVDIIQNVARSPLLFDYFYNNFTLKTGVVHNNGFFVLRPRRASEPAALPVTPLPFSFEQEGELRRVRLERPESCTLLKLTLTVDYPPTALLGRPTTLRTEVRYGEQPVLDRRLPAIEQGRPFSTYLYIGDPREFYRVYDVEPGTASIAVLDQIVITDVAFGPFDVKPRSVRVHDLGCVNLGPGTIEPAQVKNSAPTPEIVAGEPITQEFVAGQDGLRGVLLKLATYARQNSGPLIFSVHELHADGASTLVTRRTVDAQTIVDNSYFLLSFPTQTVSEGKRYRVTVEAPEATPSNAISGWYQQGDPYPEGTLTQDNSPLGGDLTFQLLYVR
jgi:hypothetical protein